MSYLHVVVEKRSSTDSICIFKDLSKKDLNKKFVKPYRLGKDIFYNGNILSPNDLSHVSIIETKQDHESELKIVQDESYKEVQEFNRTSSGVTLVSAGHGYHDHEIVECGNNVTESYIESGPGQGTMASNSAELLKHPWVVRIFAGLLFVSAAIYLGLK